MLVVFVLSVHEDVVCCFVKLSSVPRVVAVVGATAPVVAGGGDFQFGRLCLIAESIIHNGYGLLVGIVTKGVGAEPDLVDVGIEVVWHALGKAEDEGGVISTAAPAFHVELELDQSL